MFNFVKVKYEFKWCLMLQEPYTDHSLQPSGFVHFA